MKVIIAHPSAAAETSIALDAAAEVDADTGARLLADGFARLPEKKSRSPRNDTEGA